LDSVRLLRNADLKNAYENPTYANQGIAKGGNKMQNVPPEAPGFKSSVHEFNDGIKDAQRNPKDAHGNKESPWMLGRRFLPN
jgi:hypothetical protein